MNSKIEHHHLIFQAKVERNNLKKEDFENMFLKLIDKLKMKVLIPAQFAFSHQKAWTGIIGIVTSHLSFHYWTKEQYVQFDIYSCKNYDKNKAIEYLKKFWNATKIKSIVIERKVDEGFNIQIQK